MNLAIDAGNSRVKWGWHDGSGWTSLATVSLIEFAAANHDINPFAATHANPEKIIISNVAGDAAHQLIVNWTSIFDAEPHWLHGEAERCGVRSRYASPGQLGPDRWAALVAARALHAGPCLVVNSGTATTIDLLSAEGTFEGGVILPGVELMRFVLHEHTGRLPLEQGHFRAAPRNTVDAIETGCWQAQAGAVERMFRTLGPGALCIVSGGAGRVVMEQLEAIDCRYVDNLVLEGLGQDRRVVRAFFLLVVLANLAFFAWANFFSESDTQSDPRPVARQIAPEKLRVLPLAPPGRAPAAAPAKVASETPASQAVPAKACMELGAFTAADVARASEALAALSLGTRLSQRQVDDAASWWVFIPPRGSKQDAQKKADELKRLGIDEYFILQDEGPLRYALSLGVFKTEAAANNRLETLRAKGVKTAQIGARDTTLQKTYFQVRGVDESLAAKLREVAQPFTGSELRDCAPATL